LNWIAAAVLAFLAIQVAIGWTVSRRIRSEDDYLVGGRRLGYPLVIFSLFATWFGAETVIASAARARNEGVALTTAEPFAYGLCLILAGLVFARPLWRRNLTTFADLFRTRYSEGVERVAALILLPPSILWAAAQLRGFSHVINSVAPLGLETGIAAAAVFCVLYTLLGGLLADAITDLVQGVVVVAGLAVLALAVIMANGGVAPSLAAIDPARLAVAAVGSELSVLDVVEEWAIPVCGSVVAAEIVSRLIASRSGEVARNGAMLAGAAYIAVGLLPLFIGLAGGALVGATDDPEGFMPLLARTLLPGAAYALFAGALVSAMLSTVDTILLVAAGLLSHNLVAPALGIADDGKRLLLARAGVPVFGASAFVLAARADGIGALVEQASAFGSAGVLVVVCFGLFTRAGGPATAVVTLLGGLGVYLAGVYGGLAWPYLASLAASLVLYAGGCALERTRVPA
jgi:SSS family solute:Na+ symporter